MTSKPPKGPDPDDAALFRAAVAGARPLKARRLPLRQAPPAPLARFRRHDEAQVLRESLLSAPEQLELETGEELVFRRPGISARTFADLRRGRYAVKAEIDLHGLTSDQAHQALRQFLADALRDRLQCVRVIHGKGLRSGARGPVLKLSVNRWLRQWDDVLAFVSAPARDGGTGALYVLLRR